MAKMAMSVFTAVTLLVLKISCAEIYFYHQKIKHHSIYPNTVETLRLAKNILLGL